MPYIFYHYQPSMVGAVLLAAIFTIMSLLHSYQMTRTRSWFLIPFVIGGFFEAVGYCGRAASATQSPGPYTLGPFVIQSTLLLVAPALFAASIYMCLGRIVLMVRGDRALFIRRTWMTKIFVSGDVLSFFMQASGAGLLATGNVHTGNTIIIGGLIVQVIFFGVFVFATTLFHSRLESNPTRDSRSMPWRKHIVSLYVVSLLIFARSIVRVVEYVQGNNGYIISHEIYLYLFDGLLMFLVTATVAWIHPSEIAAFTNGGNVMRHVFFVKSVPGNLYLKTSSQSTGREERLMSTF